MAEAKEITTRVPSREEKRYGQGTKAKPEKGEKVGEMPAGEDNMEVPQRHMKELKGMHDRHMSERSSMHDRHQSEHRDMMKRHGDEMLKMAPGEMKAEAGAKAHSGKAPEGKKEGSKGTEP